MTLEPKDPDVRKPSRVRCAQCGTRTALLRLALYPERPHIVSGPLCDPCAAKLMSIHLGAKEVPL